MKKIDEDAFLKAGLTHEEIESVKRGISDIENGRTIPYEEVKILTRKKIFSKNKAYA